jgi:hypothetical protein
MYQTVPLNWIAGGEISLWTGPPHARHASTGASEKRWMTSNRAPHRSHSYS